MVELADTPDLGSGAFGLRVQIPSLAILCERRDLKVLPAGQREEKAPWMAPKGLNSGLENRSTMLRFGRQVPSLATYSGNKVLQTIIHTEEEDCDHNKRNQPS